MHPLQTVHSNTSSFDVRITLLGYIQNGPSLIGAPTMWDRARTRDGRVPIRDGYFEPAAFSGNIVVSSTLAACGYMEATMTPGKAVLPLALRYEGGNNARAPSDQNAGSASTEQPLARVPFLLNK
jgi:hypothetical protein